VTYSRTGDSEESSDNEQSDRSGVDVPVKRSLKKQRASKQVRLHTQTHTCRLVDGTSMNEECEAVKTTLS